MSEKTYKIKKLNWLQCSDNIWLLKTPFDIRAAAKIGASGSYFGFFCDECEDGFDDIEDAKSWVEVQLLKKLLCHLEEA